MDIRRHIQAILNTPGIEVENESLIGQAVDLYAERNIDFVDAYNAYWMQMTHLNTVYTFDVRHFSRVPFIQTRRP